MSQRAQISATTFIFFMILGIVVAGYVIRTFLVPAATTLEQGTLTKSVANLKGAFADVCAGRSAGREVQISVPSKDGVFLFHSCRDLIDTVTAISPINGKPLPSEKVDELKAKCQAVSSKGCPGVCKGGVCVSVSTAKATSEPAKDLCPLLPDDVSCDYFPCDRPIGNYALLAYGWDRSWDWWFYHSTDVELKSELLDCGKAVYALVDLGGGDYKRFMTLEKDVSLGTERVIMSG